MAQYVTDWICNVFGVEKEFEIDFSLSSAIKSNFSGYVWKFVALYLLVFYFYSSCTETYSMQ
jgi:hypothetical protein